MNTQTLPKAHEILSIVSALEGELRKLDRIGAGLAAIHVNAAIEQLRVNLRIVNDNHHDVPQFSPLHLVDSASPLSRRVVVPTD